MGLAILGVFDKLATFLLIVHLSNIIQKCQLVSPEVQLSDRNSWIAVSLAMPMDFSASHKEIK